MKLVALTLFEEKVLEHMFNNNGYFEIFGESIHPSGEFTEAETDRLESTLLRLIGKEVVKRLSRDLFVIHPDYQESNYFTKT